MTSGHVRFSPDTQCAGKRGFTGKQDAKRSVKCMERAIGQRMTVYRCAHCGLWHAGKDFRRRKAVEL